MSNEGFRKRKNVEDTVSKNTSIHKKQKRSPAKLKEQSGKLISDMITKSEQIQTSSGFFTNLVFHIVKAGLGKARSDLFCKQVVKLGGTLENDLTSDVTHLVVDEQMDIDRLCRILKIEKPPLNVNILKASWISCCLLEEKLMPTDKYELHILSESLPLVTGSKLKSADHLTAELSSNVGSKLLFEKDKSNTEKEGRVVNEKDDQKQEDGAFPLDDIPSTSTAAVEEHNPDLPDETSSRWTHSTKKGETKYDSDDSSYVGSDEEDYQKSLVSSGQSSSNASTPNASPVKLPKGNWVCARPSSSIAVNRNQLITEKLQMLLKAYENTRDRWRALSYKKAISALQRHPKEITSWEEANSIPGIGKALADKVWEIARTGHLRKIDHVCKGEEMEALNLFNNIWGVGPTVAQEWVQQGLRTLDDVYEKAKLNKQQKIGMKHYNDFLERMPRAEAGDIERTVREMAKTLHPDLLAVVCGSYRRGKQTCGDVDVLISHPDNKSHKGVLPKLLEALRQKGFITDDLIRVEEVGEQRKYMGVCKLPGENTKYRRIDIIVAPYTEYPCALLHFTGSGHFNRSMRALAKKKGMSLSEHGLCTGVVRSGSVKIHQGTPLQVNSEHDVFRYLGLQYREPEERDH